MRVHVLPHPSHCGTAEFRNKTAVVIDVLRATTCMITALGNGASAIRAASSITEARRHARKLGRSNVLLCGERGGIRIPGFDLGNSPLEFTPKTIGGRQLIMATTNGTRAVRKAEGARAIIIASFCNATAAASLILKQKRDVAILCSGKEGDFSLEDAACAGLIVTRLRKELPALGANDLAVACEALYLQWKRDIHMLLSQAEHGRYLAGIGLKKDLEICAKTDSTKTVPVWQKGRIVLEQR